MLTNIYKYRNEKGLSLRALAKRVGVSAQTICSIEAGASSPSMKLLIALSKELEVTPNDLIWNGLYDDKKAPTQPPNMEVEKEIRCPGCKSEEVKVYDIGRIKIKCSKCASILFCDLERGIAYKVD